MGATNLDELFAERGLNEEQGAVLAGVQPSTIGRITAGKVQARPATVVKLARALKVSAMRMRQLCDAHWYAAHPDEDLRGAGRYVA